MRRVPAAVLVALSSILLAGCTDSSSDDSSGAVPSPDVARQRLVHSVELADHAVSARPTMTQFPHVINASTRAYHYTLADGVRAVESSDSLLWQNTGLARTKARWLTAKAAYARITVAPDLRPERALGHDTLAWVVFYRIGLASGCVTGWRVYIDPLLAPGRNSGYVGPDYIVTTPSKSGCDKQSKPRGLLATPHFSQPWHQIRNSAGRITIRFEVGCSTGVRVVTARHGSEERVQAIVAVTDAICSEKTRTETVSAAPGVHLVPGPTGVMPARHVPIRR